jgi:tetratricopeptide (TPR) repeat protein/DNA-binding CsgD family transcriptional regulator
MSDHSHDIDEQLAAMKSDRQRLAFLLERSHAVQRTDPPLGLQLAERALLIAETLRDRRGIARSRMMLVHYLRPTTPPSITLAALKEVRDLYRALRDGAGVANLDRLIATVLDEMGEHAEAMLHAERALKCWEREGNRVGIGRTLVTIGLIRKNMGEYSGAVEALLRGAVIWEELGDDGSLGQCYNSLGLVYGQLLDYRKASECYERSLALRQASGDLQGEAATLNNIGGMLAKSGDAEKGLTYLLRAIELYRKMGMRAREIGCWNSMGGAHERLGDYVTAMRCYRAGLAIAEETGHHQTDPFFISNMGRASYKQGRYKLAMRYLKKALRMARARKLLQLECELYATIAWVYNLLRDFEASFRYSEIHSAFYKKHFGSAVQRDVADVEARIVREQAERRQEAERERAEAMQREVERTSSEVTALTLKLMQHNEMIAKLKAHIQKLEGKDMAAAVKELKVIRENLTSITDWTTLAPRFHAANDGFYGRLAERFPTLTPTELKVCSLIKANLASKDIADLLYIAVRTVEIHRGHIRKKLNLPASRSLAAFLAAV